MTQLLQNALYGTALILAAAALRRALKDRLIPEARLCLWAVCLFRLLTPAAPESVFSLWGLFQAPPPQPAQTPRLYIPAQPLPAPAPQPRSHRERPRAGTGVPKRTRAAAASSR